MKLMKQLTKTHAAFANGLVPIVCCGESLSERETERLTILC